MSVTVSRDLLGLDPLELNDFIDYSVDDQFLGGQSTWNIVASADSPYVHGEWPTILKMGNVQERVGVWAYASEQLELESKVGAVLAAFRQIQYLLTVTINGQVRQFNCQPSDTQYEMTGPLSANKLGHVVCTVRRTPVLLQGVG